MLKIKSFLRESKTNFYQLFYANRIPLNLEKGIISITFDDVPQSAFLNALPILDTHDFKATFYIAVGLGEQSNDGASNAFITPRQVNNLDSLGHEIACHTYSHYPLNSGNAIDLFADAQNNISRLKEILDSGAPINHFSYPFGSVNFEAKKLLAQRYKTMRSSRPGLNTGMTDMHLLRATSVYNPTFDKQALSDIIKKTEQLRGWLIFYTHGVEEQPDHYGCTPEQFQWLMGECASSSAVVMPVNDAYENILNHQ